MNERFSDFILFTHSSVLLAMVNFLFWILITMKNLIMLAIMLSTTLSAHSFAEESTPAKPPVTTPAPPNSGTEQNTPKPESIVDFCRTHTC